jgi:hypothetical protein
MKTLDHLLCNVPSGATVVVKAAVLGMSERAFNRLAIEIQQDDGVDDFDFVKAHRLGDADWPDSETEARPIDALTLRRQKH